MIGIIPENQLLSRYGKPLIDETFISEIPERHLLPTIELEFVLMTTLHMYDEFLQKSFHVFLEYQRSIFDLKQKLESFTVIAILFSLSLPLIILGLPAYHRWKDYLILPGNYCAITFPLRKLIFQM